MRARSEFALPVNAARVPPGPDWLHEIKYGGYRMKVTRERDCVRLTTKGGHDWAERQLTAGCRIDFENGSSQHDGPEGISRRTGPSDRLAPD